MENTFSAIETNQGAGAMVELPDRADNGCAAAQQLPLVQVPDGTTTAFRLCTKGPTAREISPSTLQGLNAKLASIQSKIGDAEHALRAQGGAATRATQQALQACLDDLASTARLVQIATSVGNTPCFPRERKISEAQSDGSSHEVEELPSGERNDTPYPFEQIKALEQAEGNLSQQTFGGSAVLPGEARAARDPSPREREAENSAMHLPGGTAPWQDLLEGIVIPMHTRLVSGPTFPPALAAGSGALFTAAFWKSRVEDLLCEVASGQGVLGFSRHLVMLAQGTFHACPLCYRPLASRNILRHFATHFSPPRRQVVYQFYRDVELGNDQWGGSSCFLRGCEVSWDPHLDKSHAFYLRAHLLTHQPLELRPYGINRTLLAEDAALAVGAPIRDQVAQLRSMDMDIVAGILNDLVPPQRLDFEAMLGRINDFLFEDSQAPRDAPPQAPPQHLPSVTGTQDVVSLAEVTLE